MNLVLDTNVLIAAFIAKGICHTLAERYLRVHSVIASEFILDELREKLTEKFKYSNEDANAVDALLRSRMRMVEPIPLESNVCRDPDDDIASAMKWKAKMDVEGKRRWLWRDRMLDTYPSTPRPICGNKRSDYGSKGTELERSVSTWECIATPSPSGGGSISTMERQPWSKNNEDEK